MKYKILDPSSLNDEICVLVGTRPGIIKFSPIIRELTKKDIDFYIFHTGQHYSYNLDKVFFNELNLREPKYHLKNMNKFSLHGEQTANMLIGIEKALIETKPKAILVGGDANTNLAGALAARKLGVNIIHIESGLRSHDWKMPEEHNRVMIDHISDILFCPTPDCKANLIRENVKGKIFVVGNSIADALNQNYKIAEKNSEILTRFGLKTKSYILFTAHREENVDSLIQLKKLKAVLEHLAKLPYDVIFPIHPRTKNRLSLNKIKLPYNIKVVEPLGYFDFLKLLKNSKIVFTDSGGIQEESCILKVPCITLRDNTERPETIKVGSNMLSGLNVNQVKEIMPIMIKKDTNWQHPYGKSVSSKMIDIIKKELLFK